eukprot:8278606-Pyramimonas_sp.AAC.2
MAFADDMWVTASKADTEKGGVRASSTFLGFAGLEATSMCTPRLCGEEQVRRRRTARRVFCGSHRNSTDHSSNARRFPATTQL